MPDQALRAGLEAARGKGRDDFPLRVRGGVFVFTIAWRHETFASCLAELHRNPALYRLLGIPSVTDIPKDYHLSRFVEVLGQEPHLSALGKVFDVLVQRLGIAVPDLGRYTAGDSTGRNGRPQKNPAAVAAEIKHGLPQPCGGRKEYQDDTGKVVKVVAWNGSKHPLVVDVRHEVPLAYRITDPKVGDNEQIKPLREQALANRPASRIETLADDKAADDEKVHETLPRHGIKPLIQNRALRQSEPERPLPGQPGRYPFNVLPDEAGTVSGDDRVSKPPGRQQMA